jgi:drug/metabolite transporter (DMT)-like permease
MLDNSNAKQKTKQSVLKHLNAGIFLALLGLFMLVVGIIFERGAEPIVVGSGLLVAGVAFIVIFFISKNYFKQEIEAEEKQLTENK